MKILKIFLIGLLGTTFSLFSLAAERITKSENNPAEKLVQERIDDLEQSKERANKYVGEFFLQSEIDNYNKAIKELIKIKDTIKKDTNLSDVEYEVYSIYNLYFPPDDDSDG
jgi:hypothetical protein